MIKNIAFGLVICVLIAGCSSRTAPVSSHTENTITTDSTHSKTVVKSDSSTYKETLKERILPAAEVGITTTKKQLDSLISALQNLPSSVTREIHVVDPHTRAMLTVLLDSLGRIQFKCTALEQHYYEKFVDQQRIINNYTSENETLKEKIKTLTAEVREQKIPFWQKAWTAIKGFSFGALFIVFLLVVLAFSIPFIKK
jgi:hypothetical protein